MFKPLSAAIAATALAATTLVFAPVAMAGSAAVRTGDLDLATDAGKAALSARIDRAARAACTSQLETGTIFRNRASPACIAEARARIEQQLASRNGKDGLGG
jgi:UrcA family protein